MYCILIPLVVGLICALLGFLLGKACANKKSECVNNERPFDANAAFAAFGKKIKENDLKAIEGIGQKIEELFHSAGINTWKQLGETPVEECQQILNKGGDKFQMHNPGTWPRQAKMAYEGKWKELKDWQDVLDGGKE